MKFKKIQDDTIQNIISHYEPSKDISKLISPQMAPDEFLQVAVDNKLYLDAVSFLAHALPLREAIYWAWLTISSIKEKFKDVPNKQAIELVQEWFENSDETNRRKCEAIAEELKLATGPAWLAEAVFWSGGSIISPKDPETLPPPYLYAKAVIGAISLGISLEETDDKVIEKNYIHALKIAFNIAQGGNGQI